MKSSMFLSVFCVAFAVAVATNIPVKDCGSKLATIESIDITPCPSIPCPFKKSTSVNVTIDFTAKSDITSAKSSVHGYIAGLPVPFPLKDNDACHKMKCPIENGEKISYKNSVDVLSEYPTIEVMVKWEIVADDDIVCFTVPVKIVD
ncbi:hypothetical protein EGW08_016493 [Elysia chlorotica]|uniref:MD-2-related lipid-recognition domain-containing protein n=1 Tax=Elysia chlorotica TaxID=188477 RepID=A0A3S1HB53_ELYCH|nr:hypothetical protein EGW08_016493 [Elysia chlorotica]